jgi:N-acetylmuramic acid 6-phosphate etherase
MVKLGYVSGNRMTNVQTRNAKLRRRAVRILMAETNLDQDSATAALDEAGGDLRIALIVVKTGRPRHEVETALAETKGVVDQAVGLLGNRK